MKTNHKQNAVKLTASLAFTSDASKSAKAQGSKYFLFLFLAFTLAHGLRCNKCNRNTAQA